MKHHKWGKSSLKRMQGVNPLLIIFAEKLLKESPYDLTIPWMGGVRTADEQKDIFEAGNSKCDGTVKRSYHQSGNALDIVIYSKDINKMYDSKKLDELSLIAKSIWSYMEFNHCSLRWGGDWTSFVDRPHWELRY